MKVLKKRAKTLKIRKSNKNTLPLNVMKKEVYHTLTKEKHTLLNLYLEIQYTEPFIHFGPLDKNKPMRFSRHKALDDFIQKIDALSIVLIKAFMKKKALNKSAFHFISEKGRQK